MASPSRLPLLILDDSLIPPLYGNSGVGQVIIELLETCLKIPPRRPAMDNRTTQRRDSMVEYMSQNVQLFNC